ncbi:MAG: helix-turn-helix transcriptional regulator [Bacteroidetes bacterium]|nr:helix-turn-helix transcriptional regulator [Bacteroidota bacterium]
MVCNCCIKVISQDLNKLNLKIKSIKLGEILIEFNTHILKENEIEKTLENNGFEIIKDKEKIIVEQIKTSVIELVHQANYNNSIIRNSDYLVEKLEMPYQQLTSIFSKYEDATLEKFIIKHKIEKVKELIEYDELTLSEIAFQMGYSSVQYLSTQFKTITGYSVSEYKNLPDKERMPLDLI